MSTFGKILAKIFGTRNSRMLSKLKPTVAAIKAHEDALKALSDNELKSYTLRFQKDLSEGKTLDEILPLAFAVVREASHRVLNMRHFDVQLIGGIALHKGWIAEAKTGEGKTLMATLPSYLNGLTREGVHVIVPNSYLAKRDAEWMGKVHEFLGLTVASVTAEDSFEVKQKAYAADIVYTTNHALGFDYLRDNMRVSDENKLIPKLNFCIVDEVDSILIDDARTPLIITGPADTSSELYQTIYDILNPFSISNEETEGDVEINLQDRKVFLTDTGTEKLQSLLLEKAIIAQNTSLFDLENTRINHYINACLSAKHLFRKDVDYVMENNQVVIIEESTGRKAIGRRWGNGIHQALEAKESVTIRQETQTMASITYQNLFRLYDKLSGMTGTADTEAAELKSIYNLDVLVIPTNKPLARVDLGDLVFITGEAKTQAIIDQIKVKHQTGQPLLVGTSSIEYSEFLSSLLHKEGIKHEVLNAKQHEREAQIIAQAGRLNAVTIATNMAGRGTDILLGGCPDEHTDWESQNKAVIAAGGLHVIGTERNESRRVDNQLRGRSGRQGDIGSSQFFVSFDDRLIKRFKSDTIVALLKRLDNSNDPVSSPLLTRQIEGSQKRIESRYYDARRELLKMDDVANHQRQIIYTQRNELLASNTISDIVESMLQFTVNDLMTKYVSQEAPDMWQLQDLDTLLKEQYEIDVAITATNDRSEVENMLRLAFEARVAEKKRLTDEETFQHIEKQALIFVLDKSWKHHLSAMDDLKQGIDYRSLAQKNPVHEFKKDSFTLFERMLSDIKLQTIRQLCLVKISPPPSEETPSSGGYQINMSPPRKHHEQTET